MVMAVRGLKVLVIAKKKYLISACFQTLIEGIRTNVSRPKKLKRVAVQRDFFERHPGLVILPFIGGIYR